MSMRECGSNQIKTRVGLDRASGAEGETRIAGVWLEQHQICQRTSDPWVGFRSAAQLLKRLAEDIL